MEENEWLTKRTADNGSLTGRRCQLMEPYLGYRYGDIEEDDGIHCWIRLESGMVIQLHRSDVRVE